MTGPPEKAAYLEGARRPRQSLDRIAQERTQRVGGDIATNESLADVARQDEADPAVLDLLVLAHELQQGIGVDAVDFRAQADAGEMAAHAKGGVLRTELQPGRQVERHRH